MKIWHYAMVVFLGGCSYGILSTFVKLAYTAGFSMAEVTASQYLFGTLFIWIAVLIRNKNGTILTKRQVLIFLISGIPMGLTGIFYYQSLQTTNASLAIIFLFQFVWIGTLIEWIIYKRKPDRFKIISIIILLMGSFLAAGILSGGIKEISLVGTAWGLLAACTFSMFILISGVVGNDTPPILKSALFSTGALILVMILFPPMFLFDLTFILDIAPYGSLLGLFGVVLPPLLFSIGMPHVGPGFGTILSASELPIAVIMSAIILGEHVTSIQWFGVIIILAGITLGNTQFILKKEDQPSTS